jgi:hypothetical protein
MLPPEAAFAVAMTDGWTDAQELRAAQVEVTHALYRATLAAHGSKRVPRQLRIPRPRLAVAKRPATTDETIAFFTGGSRG